MKLTKTFKIIFTLCCFIVFSESVSAVQAPPVGGVGVVVKRNNCKPKACTKSCNHGGASKVGVTNEKGQLQLTITKSGDYTLLFGMPSTRTPQAMTEGGPIAGTLVNVCAGAHPSVKKCQTFVTNVNGEIEWKGAIPGLYTIIVEGKDDKCPNGFELKDGICIPKIYGPTQPQGLITYVCAKPVQLPNGGQSQMCWGYRHLTCAQVYGKGLETYESGQTCREENFRVPPIIIADSKNRVHIKYNDKFIPLVSDKVQSYLEKDLSSLPIEKRQEAIAKLLQDDDGYISEENIQVLAKELKAKIKRYTGVFCPTGYEVKNGVCVPIGDKTTHSNIGTVEESLDCKCCGKTVSGTFGDNINHTKTCCKKTEAIVMNTMQEQMIAKHIKDKGKAIVECTCCGASMDISKINQHVRECCTLGPSTNLQSGGNPMFKCKCCNKEFNSAPEVVTHAKTCDACPKTTTTSKAVINTGKSNTKD